MSEVINKTTTRSLRHDFTAAEMHDLSVQLAGKTKEQSRVLDEKKSVTAQYSAKLAEISAACNRIANQVSDGFEFRDVKLDVLYHEPKHGMKTLVRQDNGERIEEPMDAYEFNLFNQPDDGKIEDEEQTEGKSESDDDFFGPGGEEVTGGAETPEAPADKPKKRGRKKKGS